MRVQDRERPSVQGNGTGAARRRGGRSGRMAGALALLGLLPLAAVLVGTAEQGGGIPWGPVLSWGEAATCSAGDPVAGFVEGEYETTPGGAATYRVPIQVPPGTAGMEPVLSLVYDSQAGGGLLGKGWRLGGLTAIERCPRTLATDGVAGTVDYGRTDRFCLEGSRLVAVEDAAGRPLTTRAERDAAYGLDGTVYHTEVESWTRVTSRQDDAGESCGGGPCWFEAVEKSGVRFTFGRTGRSAAPAVGPRFAAGQPLAGAVRRWGLDRREDLNGNFLTVTYNPSDETGQSYPVRLDYTGSTAAGQAPQRSVRFEVRRDRPDVVTTWQGGAGVMHSARLDAVQTYLGERPVLRYQLAYDQAPSTGRSRVRTVELRDAAGCRLLPTQLTWQDNRLDLVEDALFSTGSFVEESFEVPLDLTGNGLGDFVRVQPLGSETAFEIWVSDGSTYKETFDAYSTGVPWNGGRFFPADVDGSGRGGLVLVYPRNGQQWGSVWVSNGNKLVNEAAPVALGSEADDRYLPTDLDGDGRTDVVRAVRDGRGEVRLATWRSNGSTFKLSSSETITQLPFDGSSFVTLDLDGDARGDLAVVHEVQGRARVALFVSTGSGLARREPDVELGPWDDRYSALSLDVNGDGSQDLLRAYRDDAHDVALDVLLSDGHRLVGDQAAVPAGERWDGSSVFATDLNGDGRSDLVLLAERSRHLHARPWISGGDRLVRSDLELDLGLAETDLAVLPVDTDGDGLGDLLHLFLEGSSAYAQSWLSSGPFPDLVSRVEDGTGGWIDVEYGTLSDPVLYTRGSGAVYPRVDVQGTFHVVARQTAHDGRGDPQAPPDRQARDGHLYATSHHYRGAVNDFHGRGWQGFREVTATDVYTGQVTVTSLLQEFPFTGFAAATEVRCAAPNPVDPRCTADGTVLSAERTTYLCQPGAPCSGEDAALYQPYPGVYQVLAKRAEQESWDYGKHLYTLAQEYRAYTRQGDPTDVLQVRDADPARNVTECRYYLDGSGRWAFGYPTDQLLLAGEARCPRAPAWSGAALGWQRLEYDDRLRPVSEGEWDDARAGGGFLTRAYRHDGQGNRTRESIPYYPAPGLDPAMVPASETVYDTRYHTFPAETRTPPNQAGQRLVVAHEHDAAFGVETLTTDPNGSQDQALVDGFGRSHELRTTGPNGKLVPVERTRWERDGEGLSVVVERRTRWDADTWSWQRSRLDGMGRSYRVESVAAEPSRVVVRTFGFDALGQQSRESLPCFQGTPSAGATVTTFDLYEREVKVEEPDGTVTELSYSGSADGESVTSVAAAGTAGARKVSDRFNRLGDLVERQFYPRKPDGAWGTPVLLTFRYDPLQRLVRSEDAAGVVDRVEYDSLGRDRWGETTGPDGYSLGRTTYHYDEHGGLRETVKPASSDTAGAEQRVVLEYDDLGRTLTRKLVPVGPTYTFVYDAPSPFLPGAVNTKGQLTGVSASDGSVAYGFSYDPQGNPVRQSLALGHGQPVRELRVGYDPLERQESLTFPDGTEQWNRYNLDGSLASIDLRLPGAASPRPFVTWEDYDAFQVPGRVRYLDRQGSEVAAGTYAYAPTTGLVRRATLQRRTGDGARLLDHALSWTPLGQVAAVVDCNFQGNVGRPECSGGGGHPTDYSQSFGHDALGRLIRAQGIYGDLDYRYGGAGNLEHKGGVDYRYVGHQVRSGSDGYAAEYYPNGNLERRTAVHTGGGERRTVNWSYTWDAADRLAAARREDGGATTRFAYDHLDARVAKADADGTTTLYYGDLFEVTLGADGVVEEHRVVLGPTGRLMVLSSEGGSGAASADGGMAGTAGMAGGAGGGGGSPLVRPLLLALLLAVLLGLLGRLAAPAWRLARKVVEAARWVIRPLHATRPPPHRAPRWVRRLAVPVALCTMVTVCLPHPALAAPAAPAAPAAGAATAPTLQIAFFHHDQVGSTTLAVAEDGELVSHLVYRPFGALDREHSIDPDLVEARFDDQIWDPEADLYYFNARYYDPAVGRFLSADTVAGADDLFPSAFDRYAFGDNDPVDYADPSGHLAILAAILIGAAVGAAVSGAVYGISTAVSGEEFSWAAFGIVVGAGALGGAIGGAFGGSILVGGVVGGAVSAGVEQVVTNLATGEVWSNNLAEAVVFGAVIGGLTAGALKGAGKLRGLRRACASFPEGSQVYTFGGPSDVTEVLGGESVWAVGEEVGEPGGAGDIGSFEPEPQLVSFSVERNAGELVRLAVAAEEIRATPEHPFLVEGRGWVPAGQVRRGDRLVDGFGEAFPVREVGRERGLFRVFNFTVDEAHTYLVGDSAFLVHNTKCRIKKGGAYGHQQVNVGEEIDHIPAKRNYKGIKTIRGKPLSVYRGPSVRMTRQDHLRTTSWGSSEQAKKLRQRHRKYIEQGRFDRALEEDVVERVTKFKGRYNEGLKAAVAYSYDKGYITLAQHDRIERQIK